MGPFVHVTLFTDCSMETVSHPKYSVQACSSPVLGQTLSVSGSGFVVASWLVLFLMLSGLVLCWVSITAMQKSVYCGCLFRIFRQTNAWERGQVYWQGNLLPVVLAGHTASCVSLILNPAYFTFIFVWGQGYRYPNRLDYRISANIVTVASSMSLL